ncbi:MAG: hypothetical protein VX107_13280 [Pseudomonadota bacterium]|nr:hypothetical protein [Pseudomonadota bacterium]
MYKLLGSGSEMVPELDYLKSSDEHLKTWSRLCKLFTISTVSIAILLLIMAATLV